MKLHEPLKVCLLSLASRYPQSVVEINEAVLGHQNFWTEACRPLCLLALLESHAPHLLQVPALIEVYAAQSVVHLVGHSEETPAFWIYCGGCTPSQREKQTQTA